MTNFGAATFIAAQIRAKNLEDREYSPDEIERLYTAHLQKTQPSTKRIQDVIVPSTEPVDVHCGGLTTY
jgi:hypothetical protein